jgi:hypothetical protein
MSMPLAVKAVSCQDYGCRFGGSRRRNQHRHRQKSTVECDTSRIANDVAKELKNIMIASSGFSTNPNIPKRNNLSEDTIRASGLQSHLRRGE